MTNAKASELRSQERNEDLLTEWPTLGIPRSCHNAQGDPLRKQQVLKRSLGARILQLHVCPFDRYPDICRIRALNSRRARQYRCSNSRPGPPRGREPQRRDRPLTRKWASRGQYVEPDFGARQAVVHPVGRIGGRRRARGATNAF